MPPILLLLLAGAGVIVAGVGAQRRDLELVGLGVVLVGLAVFLGYWPLI